MPNLKKMKRVIRLETSVCFLTTRLMKNQIIGRRRATSPKRRESDDKNAVAIVKSVSQLVCFSQDSDALVSQTGKQSQGKPMQKVLGSIRKGRFTQSTPRHAGILEKKRTIAWNCTSQILRQRSPYAKKIEDQSHEETERQQRCARSKAWNLAKNIFKLKEKDQVTFCSPAEEWVVPAASTKEMEESEFVVDSGASMEKVSMKDLNSAELETMRTSKSPTTVMTANGEVQRREEATENARELDLFVTVMLLEETPAVLSLEKLCEDHVYTNHWTSGQKTHISPKRARELIAICQTVLGLSTSSSATSIVYDVNRSTENQYKKEVEVRVRSYGETRCINPQKPKTRVKDAKK